MLQKASVCSCEHMCPADMLQCAVSVCEREGGRWIKEKRKRKKGSGADKKEKKARGNGG